MTSIKVGHNYFVHIVHRSFYTVQYIKISAHRSLFQNKRLMNMFVKCERQMCYPFKSVRSPLISFNLNLYTIFNINEIKKLRFKSELISIYKRYSEFYGIIFHNFKAI